MRDTPTMKVLHALNVYWGGRNTQQVYVKCPCGWQGTPRDPAGAYCTADSLAEYKAHP